MNCIGIDKIVDIIHSLGHLAGDIRFHPRRIVAARIIVYFKSKGAAVRIIPVKKISSVNTQGVGVLIFYIGKFICAAGKLIVAVIIFCILINKCECFRIGIIRFYEIILVQPLKDRYHLIGIVFCVKGLGIYSRNYRRHYCCCCQQR